jgi:hypothetical protein
MGQKNAGAKERNKQHRVRPLILTAPGAMTVSASAFQNDFVASEKWVPSRFSKRLWRLRYNLALGCLKPIAAFSLRCGSRGTV